MTQTILTFVAIAVLVAAGITAVVHDIRSARIINSPVIRKQLDEIFGHKHFDRRDLAICSRNGELDSAYDSHGHYAGLWPMGDAPE